MINNIKIASYKSIDKLEFELGRINVLIGENGAGKSNILEAIALAGAASANKLDNEFLTSRGIRVTRPEYMRPAFPGFDSMTNIELSLDLAASDRYYFTLTHDNAPYSKWNVYLCPAMTSVTFDKKHELFPYLIKIFQNNNEMRDAFNNSEKITVEIKHSPEMLKKPSQLNDEMKKIFYEITKYTQYIQTITDFIIYSPENSSLRTFQREGQIEPLGINGEGLLKLLSVLSRPEYSDCLNEIKHSLQILGWFEDLKLTEPDTFAGSRMEIKDRYLEEDRRYFDQLSTNEGFLFLLFYFALFSTELTPKFFAIDNIDASLNPKLCEKLMLELVRLAQKHDKQVIFTTHNPAILDGLNLDDDEQRLFVVSRNANGATRMKRISKRKKPIGERPTRLSEMFLRGILGGLPKGF